MERNEIYKVIDAESPDTLVVFENTLSYFIKDNNYLCTVSFKAPYKYKDEVNAIVLCALRDLEILTRKINSEDGSK